MTIIGWFPPISRARLLPCIYRTWGIPGLHRFIYPAYTAQGQSGSCMHGSGRLLRGIYQVYALGQLPKIPAEHEVALHVRTWPALAHTASTDAAGRLAAVGAIRVVITVASAAAVAATDMPPLYPPPPHLVSESPNAMVPVDCSRGGASVLTAGTT